MIIGTRGFQTLLVNQSEKKKKQEEKIIGRPLVILGFDLTTAPYLRMIRLSNYLVKKLDAFLQCILSKIPLEPNA